MKLKERLFLLFSLYFWAVLLFWFFGSLFFFVLPVSGVFYLFLGGKKHA